MRQEWAPWKAARTVPAPSSLRWDGLSKAYETALPGIGTDPAFDSAREKLVAFGREVRERPDLVAVLREREEAFSMAERPALRRMLADARPERVIADMMEGSERAMRTQQQEQVRQQAEAKLRQVQRLSRG